MNRIGDYAIIGDCHSAALVGRDGSIDWACFPRFDSPAVFAAVLDAARGGAWSVTAVDASVSERHYVVDTNVLVTTFTCPTGVLEVTDCMPVERVIHDAQPAHAVTAHASILRRLRCTEGTVVVRSELAPRFEYGAFRPRFRATGPCTADVIGGGDALDVRATRPIEATDHGIMATWTLGAGDHGWIDVAWRRSYEPRPLSTDVEVHALECARRLEATLGFWRAWMAGCAYDGLHSTLVRRSALALKAMTYAPSGAVVAAPTTSLPEEIGGVRNWDYRYTWIRDATLTLTSLMALGFREEADAFKAWLERTGAGHPEDLQIMYGIGGERSLPERELSHLAGHRGSAPVRIGNGAATQVQLDAYGQILEAAYLYARAGGALDASNWRFLAGLVDVVCARWSEPDQGLWEIRDQPRHFTHSKANCWLALHRGVQLATAGGLPGDVTRWAVERDRVHAYVLEACAPAGWFQQAADHPVADAATLLVAALGLVPTAHPIARETIAVVRRDLERGGLVARYFAADGLGGGEGAFLLCSFWLVDSLTFSGQLDEATALLDGLVARANDVGLFAEEIDPMSGEQLGNFPQAFSHMALVTSCAHLTAARAQGVPEGAVDYAEHALARLRA